MDPPSLILTMVPSAEHQSRASPRSSRQGGSIFGVDTQASRELLRDQLVNMVAQEERDGYQASDYMRYYQQLQNQKPRVSKNIDERCRTSICGWMYRVADHFSIDREGTRLHVFHNSCSTCWYNQSVITSHLLPFYLCIIQSFRLPCHTSIAY